MDQHAVFESFAYNSNAALAAKDDALSDVAGVKAIVIISESLLRELKIFYHWPDQAILIVLYFDNHTGAQVKCTHPAKIHVDDSTQ